MSSPNETASAFRVDGKVCLITGGASGLGLAGAKALLQAGATGITLVDLSPSSLLTALSSPALAPFTDRIHTFAGDIGEESVNAGMIRSAVERWGRAPEVVVLCAGISQAYQVGLVDMEEGVWDRVMRVNLKGCESPSLLSFLLFWHAWRRGLIGGVGW